MVKKITAPHTKQELLDAFKIFDPEGKGKMGVDEITPILTLLGEQLISEEHRAVFLRKMLANPNDKEIEFGKFIDWMLS